MLNPIVHKFQEKGCMAVAKYRFGWLLKRVIEHWGEEQMGPIINQFIEQADLLEHGESVQKEAARRADVLAFMGGPVTRRRSRREAATRAAPTTTCKQRRGG